MNTRRNTHRSHNAGRQSGMKSFNEFRREDQAFFTFSPSSQELQLCLLERETAHEIAMGGKQDSECVLFGSGDKTATSSCLPPRTLGPHHSKKLSRV